MQLTFALKSTNRRTRTHAVVCLCWSCAFWKRCSVHRTRLTLAHQQNDSTAVKRQDTFVSDCGASRCTCLLVLFCSCFISFVCCWYWWCRVGGGQVFMNLQTSWQCRVNLTQYPLTEINKKRTKYIMKSAYTHARTHARTHTRTHTHARTQTCAPF